MVWAALAVALTPACSRDDAQAGEAVESRTKSASGDKPSAIAGEDRAASPSFGWEAGADKDELADEEDELAETVVVNGLVAGDPAPAGVKAPPPVSTPRTVAKPPSGSIEDMDGAVDLEDGRFRGGVRGRGESSGKEGRMGKASWSTTEKGNRPDLGALSQETPDKAIRFHERTVGVDLLTRDASGDANTKHVLEEAKQKAEHAARKTRELSRQQEEVTKKQDKDKWDDGEARGPKKPRPTPP